MKRKIILITAIVIAMTANAQRQLASGKLVDWHCHNVTANLDSMLIRISEIEVYPEYLDEYLQYALTVGQESVEKEPGVVCIYPMVQQRDSCQIRILEIYADQDAYKHHIQTPHFQTYKQGTLHMVKSLDLVDMDAMNPDVRAMIEIFRKLR